MKLFNLFVCSIPNKNNTIKAFEIRNENYCFRDGRLYEDFITFHIY